VGFIKLNFYVALKGNPSEGGIGGICCDWDCKVLMLYAVHCCFTSHKWKNS